MSWREELKAREEGGRVQERVVATSLEREHKKEWKGILMPSWPVWERDRNEKELNYKFDIWFLNSRGHIENRAIWTGTSAESITGCAVHSCVFSCLAVPRPCSKAELRFRLCAAGGRLLLTHDDLVRCERALSNLGGNKLEVIFYEDCVQVPCIAVHPYCALSTQLMCL